MRPRSKRVPNAGKPVTPADFRGWFPNAKVLCECPEDRDVCPEGCAWLARSRKAVVEWLAGSGESA